jgi:RNA polymerase sigma-70 factor (ECF subfamily)
MIAFATEARPIELPNHERPALMSRRPSALLERSRETSRLARLRAGDEDAYDALVRDYGGRLLAVARRMLRSEEDANDAVQDAFVSAFASIHRFRGGSSLYTWLHRIVVNACLMQFRSRGRRSEVSLESLLPTFDESGTHSRPITSWSKAAPKNLERAEVRAAVRACIDRLPNDYRQILVLRDIEELNTAKTAELLGISHANVKTRLHRARRALRTLLGPTFVDGEITARERDNDQPVGVASN